MTVPCFLYWQALHYSPLVNPDTGGSAAAAAADEMGIRRTSATHTTPALIMPTASWLCPYVWCLSATPPSLEHDLPVDNTLALHGVAYLVFCRSLVPCLVCS